MTVHSEEERLQECGGVKAWGEKGQDGGEGNAEEQRARSEEGGGGAGEKRDPSATVGPAETSGTQAARMTGKGKSGRDHGEMNARWRRTGAERARCRVLDQVPDRVGTKAEVGSSQLKS